jgi:Xaa-Pro aminopeptidase
LPGNLVFLEIGACAGRYHVAAMRTLYCGNELPEKLRLLETRLLAAMDCALEAVKPGAVGKEVDNAARVSFGNVLGVWMPPRTGYSIGIGFFTDWADGFMIDAHSDAVLREGMVLHIMPWVQIADEGAMGFSDTVVVTDRGCESLLPPQEKRGIALVAPHVDIISRHLPCVSSLSSDVIPRHLSRVSSLSSDMSHATFLL